MLRDPHKLRILLPVPFFISICTMFILRQLDVVNTFDIGHGVNFVLNEVLPLLFNLLLPILLGVDVLLLVVKVVQKHVVLLMFYALIRFDVTDDALIKCLVIQLLYYFATLVIEL